MPYSPPTGVSERPGAPESNAGDEFHVLWAARRAVRLLDLRSSADCVVIEGVGRTDDPDGDDAFLGVDVAEYEGGTSFAEAARARFSQLKYSTRHPGRAWTAARLAAGGRGSGQKRAVVYRLAQEVRGLREAHGADAVASGLSVCLVSNQPVAAGLLASLGAARRLLEGPSPPTGTKRLLDRLSRDSADDLRRLYEASGLGSRDFVLFVRVLDLSGTGEASVDLQRVRLVQELGLAATTDPTRGVRALERLISIDASPHGVGSLGLTAQDVWAALGVAETRDLYPAPARFRAPEDPIPVGEAAALASVVVAAGSAPVVAHGPAGVGKTTTVLQAADHLPAGSEMVIYDCYGDGSYLDVGSERHTPRRALTQLTNELAARFGTPFLIDRDLGRHDLFRRFLDALEQAGRLVPDGAVLVVAVDAADNAAFAAQREGDRSVVPGLLRAALPPGVRLLVTARTHRTSELDPPPGHVAHELRGFDLGATAAHVRRRFGGATDDEVLAMHERTGGRGRSLANPRVQAYVLGTADTVADAVAMSSATPQPIFDDLYRSAVEQALDAGQALDWVATLVAMGRPAPVRAFADLVETDEASGRRFVRALEPGVVLEEGEAGTSIGFRDEDFETDLRGRVGEGALQRAHARIAETLLGRVREDPYAASVVADHLFAAKRTDALLGVVLDGPRPDVIEDPLARLRVNRRRAALGIRAAAAGADRVATARVLFVAAEFTRGEEATVRLIQEAPGLAVRFGDAETVAGVYVRGSTEPWKGPAHLHAAVLLARAGDLGAARDHDRASEAWVQRRKSLMSVGEASEWRVSDEDIAREAEVSYWLSGAAEAYRSVTRWYPRPVRAGAAFRAIREVAARGGAEPVERALRTLTLSAAEAAVAVAACWDAGVVLDGALVGDVAGRVAALAAPRRRQRGEAWAVGFAEAAARSGVGAASLRRILSAFGPAPPQHVPGTFEGATAVSDWLRVTALLAGLDGEVLAAPEIRPGSTAPLPDLGDEATREERAKWQKTNESRKEDRERWDSLVGAVLPAYQLRADAMLGRLTSAEARSAPAVADLIPWTSRVDHRPGSFSRYLHGVEVRLDALGFAGAEASAVTPLLDSVAEGGAEACAAAWLALAARAQRWPRMASAVEDAVERAVEAVADEALPARDRWTVLWQAADRVQDDDPAWAAELYARAVETASDLDDDGARLLGALAGLLEGTGQATASDAGRALARRLARAVEHHAPYVSDARYLPRTECVQAAAAVDAQGGLALAARWDDEGQCDLDDGIGAACRATGATGGIAPEAVLPLLRLVPYGVEMASEVLPHLDRLRMEGAGGRARLSALVEDVCRWVLRDVPAGTRRHVTRQLADWASAHGLSGLPGMGLVTETAAFLEGVHEREATNEAARRPPPPESDGPTPWQLEQEARDRAADAAYDAAVADGRRGAFGQLGVRLAGAGYRNRRTALLTAVREVVPRRHRPAFLDALVALDPGPGGRELWARDVLSAFSEAVGAWSQDTRVRGWLAAGAAGFTERWLPVLLRETYGVAESVRTLFALPGLGDRGPEITVAAVARRVGDLDAESLLHVGAVLAEGFSDDEKRSLVAAVLDDWERQAALPPLPHSSGDAELSVGGFLWAAFGHHDREVRWRALHAARAVVGLGGTDTLAALVAWSHETEAGPYRSASEVFYWQAARVTLHALLLRLVHEDPAWVLPFAGLVAERALSAAFPHVQVRELARRTALALEAAEPGTYGADVAERLEVTNRPVGRVPRPEGYRHSPYDSIWSEAREATRFSFDFLDQVPYWYERAERRLDVPALSVLERADAWICDAWGLPDAGGRSRRRLGYGERDDHVYKGSHPRFMGVQEHLTLHAMFCAVGQLVDEGAALQADAFDDDDDWDRWLRPYLPASDERWVHDLLGPTPLAGLWWGDVPASDGWDETGGLADYDALLGLPEGAGAVGEVQCQEVVVLQMAEAKSRATSTSLVVNSCLVTPETAAALQRAFQSGPDWRSNAMPTGWHDEAFDTPGFALQRWVARDGPDEALDEADPLIFGRGLQMARPLRETAAALGLVRDGMTWRDRRGQAVFRVEAWSDAPPGRREETEPYSAGTRLWVRVDALLSYLDATGMDLLVEAGISHYDRRYRSYGADDDRRHDDGHAVYTLVRRDGTFRSLDLDRRFGPADGSGVG